MVLSCTGKSKATITIISPSKEIIIGSAPVDVNLTTQNQQDFVDRTYQMTSPIDETFDKPVTLVEILNTEPWIGQQDPIGYAPCPILRIDGNRAYSYFEARPEYYSDNSGSCSYRIFFSSNFNLKIIDKDNNTIFNQSYNVQPKYTVACDDECPIGTTKCFSTNYPGYCCLPCSEIAGEIKAIANQVRRLNNG